MAQEWKIPRAEQDKFAYESHKKAAAAYELGYMDDLIVPCAGVFRDNNLRADITLEKLATLKPAFEKSERGTLTAGNSTPLTDGAATALIASEDWAAKHNLPVLAYLTHGQHIGNNFVGGDGLLMAPTIAVSKMLDRAGLTLQDFDFYEIHEAFAAQVLCTLKAWEDADYCKKTLGQGCSARFDRPGKAQRQGIFPRLRTPLCCNGRAHCREHGEASLGQRRPWPDLGLHRRRHGRRRHYGGTEVDRRPRCGLNCPTQTCATRALYPRRRRSDALCTLRSKPAGERRMGARDDKQLEAARSLIRDLADRLDLNAWARLWDGTRLPLGKAPTSNFEIAISDPGVIGAILRSPRLDTIIRQYVEKGIDFSGGTLVDFGSGLQKGKMSLKLKAARHRDASG